MTPIFTRNRIGNAVTALVVIGLIALGFVVKTNHNDPSVSAGTSAPLPSFGAPPSPGVPSDDAFPAALSNEQKSQLVSQLAQFLPAYYTVKPNDSVESWRKRLDFKYVPSKVLGSLDPPFSPGTDADNQRKQNGWLVKGTLQTEQIGSEAIKGDPSNLDVSAPVTVTTTQPNGTVVEAVLLNTGTSWKYANGQWSLQSVSSS
jgi:hypothetical protein